MEALMTQPINHAQEYWRLILRQLYQAQAARRP
jgi:hypothetical protein